MRSVTGILSVIVCSAILSGCIIVHHIQPQFSQDGTVNIEIRTDSDDPNVNVAVDDVTVTWDELKALMEMKKSGVVPSAGAKGKSGSCAPAHPAREAAAEPPGVQGLARMTHSVQVGAYRLPEYAHRYAAALSEKGYPARVLPMADSNGRSWYLVRIGDYASAEEAQIRADEFSRSEGAPSIVRPYGRF